MAAKKTESAKTKKTAVKSKGTAKPAKTEAKKVSQKKAVQKVAPARPANPPPPMRAQEVIPVEPKPSARTCPLVLDGITAPERFTPRDCMSCDEFDCRFYSAEERSSGMGSRLFVSEEDDGDDFDDDGDNDDGGFYDDAGADGDDDFDEMR